VFGTVTFTVPVFSYPFCCCVVAENIEEAEWKAEWVKSSETPAQGVEICEGKTRVSEKYYSRSRAVAIQNANTAIRAMIEAGKIIPHKDMEGPGYFRLTPIKLPSNSTLNSYAVFMAMQAVITKKKLDKNKASYIGNITFEGRVFTNESDLTLARYALDAYKEVVVGQNIRKVKNLGDIQRKPNYVDYVYKGSKPKLKYAESVGISFSFGGGYPGQLHRIMTIMLQGKGLTIIGHDHAQGVGGIQYIVEKSIKSLYGENVFENNKFVVAFEEPVTGPSFTLSIIAAIIAVKEGCKVQPWPMTGLAPVFCLLNLEEVAQLKNEKLFCVLYCKGKGKVAHDNKFAKMVVWEGNAGDLRDYDVQLIKIPYAPFLARLRGDISKDDLINAFRTEFLNKVLTTGSISSNDQATWDEAMLKHDKMGLWKPIQNNTFVQIGYSIYLVTLFPIIWVLDLTPNLIGYITRCCDCPCSESLINFTCESFVLFTSLFLVMFSIYLVSFLAHKIVDLGFDILKIPFQFLWITISWLIMWFTPWFTRAEFALAYRPYSKMAFDEFWSYVLYLTAPFKWFYNVMSETLEWLRYFQRIETQKNRKPIK
jgi:hypothetical protein